MAIILTLFIGLQKKPHDLIWRFIWLFLDFFQIKYCAYIFVIRFKHLKTKQMLSSNNNDDDNYVLITVFL